ncbi:retron Eco8 family effector endonuclease [Arcobacter sp. YIC-80]|uniref:retron Eco8 family effector endonuclease n=1 Tax=Arcobacter sp. YIC-80 TaxID=3376683 RepID=UPI00384CE544
MSISKIEITNLLSFDKLTIDDFREINCIVGMNNVGKSNFLKLIQFYYLKLDKKRALPPKLNNNYTPYGTITITYNLEEIRNIVTRKRNNGKSDIFPAIFNTFFSDKSFLNLLNNMSNININSSTNDKTDYKLTLFINKDESIYWSTNDREILKFINYLYPFFYINTRKIDLHDWSYLWEMISKIKTYKIKKVKQKDFLSFIDNQMKEDTNEINSKYSDDIKKFQNIINRYGLDLSNYSFNEKIINLIKTGLDGHDFNFHGEEIDIQSDGTNSSNYLQIFISLMLILSRREYIIPALYIDEPEIGLHPKKSEEFIYNIYNIFEELNVNNSKKQYPHILISTHSPIY